MTLFQVWNTVRPSRLGQAWWQKRFWELCQKHNVFEMQVKHSDRCIIIQNKLPLQKGTQVDAFARAAVARTSRKNQDALSPTDETKANNRGNEFFHSSFTSREEQPIRLTRSREN